MQEENIKPISTTLINRIRRSPMEFGLTYLDLDAMYKYTDYEITEMYYGIDKKNKRLFVDEKYFVSLSEVDETLCELVDVSYIKKPTKADLETNRHNSLKNIKTFYIKDYFLITNHEISGNYMHKITNYLLEIGAINKGRNQFSDFYSISNDYQTLQKFKTGLYPKDLYHPIKRYVNGLFFNDDYKINAFEVKSDITFNS